MTNEQRRKHEENWAAIIKAATEMRDPKGMAANVILAVDSLQQWAEATQKDIDELDARLRRLEGRR